MVAASTAHGRSLQHVRLQELLFKKLFGNEETDLVDESETAEGAAGGEASGEAADGAPAAAAAALEIQEGETPAAFARRVFRAVFEEDVQRLLSMVRGLMRAFMPPGVPSHTLTLTHPHTPAHTSHTSHTSHRLVPPSTASLRPTPPPHRTRCGRSVPSL